jgi:large subunit ribosomal protein L23
MSGAVSRQERLLQVLLGPHVSEKSSAAVANGNQVVFKVRRDANKSEIRQAVEKLFEVKVANVTVMRVAGKAKRHGAQSGQRSQWKKAYVRLAPGNSIEFMGGE